MSGSENNDKGSNNDYPPLPDHNQNAPHMSDIHQDLNGQFGNMNLPSDQPMQFSDEEIQNLKEIFDLFDKQNEGAIQVSDLDAIMQSLQRDPQEAKDLLQNIRNQNPNQTDLQKVSFDEFIQLMQHVENKLAKDDPNGNHQMDWNKNSQGIISITADNKVLDFLRLLEEYRKKCEIEGNYQEAKKAAGKFEELLRKETIRQKNNIRAAQEQELQNIEAAQKAQFLEFSQAWDNYMSDYEATAYLSLEKLKEKHMLEFQQFQDKIRKELTQKMKFSKDLLDLRDREAKLVRMKRYDEAEKIKMKADLLEEFERNKLDAEMDAVIEKKEAKLRHNQ